jgi:class 3 adenylate cyclase
LKPSIGITTGRAFCGAVGSESRREYAMVGDIVNLSARLMGKAKALGIFYCQKTQRELYYFFFSFTQWHFKRNSFLISFDC